MKKEILGYQLIEHIGEGSYGQVYRATHKGSSRPCAVKLITKKGRSARELASLRGEIDIMKKLKHENIIELIESHEGANEFVVVTELADRDLSAELDNRGSLPQEEVRSVGEQIVSALLYLNEHRIVHRDLKPQNILISQGKIKLCDFGFARKMSVQTVVLRSLKGTPLYIAPQIFKEQPYNYKIDIWSLGIILYELFSGMPPYYSDNYYSLFNKIINEPVQFPADMSPELAQLIQMMIQKQPDARADWAQITASPFFTRTATPSTLTFSIQLEPHPKLRASMLPPAPPMITMAEVLKFDQESLDNPLELRSSLLFYHKAITLFAMIPLEGGIPPEWAAILLAVLGRVAKQQPQHPLQFDILTKKDLLHTVIETIPFLPEQVQSSAAGVVGLILKVRGSSISKDEAELVVQTLQPFTSKPQSKPFLNTVKVFGILSQTSAECLTGVAAPLMESVKADAPREHSLVFELIRAMVRAKLPIVPIVMKHLPRLQSWLQREDGCSIILSLYAHIVRRTGDSTFLKDIKNHLVCPKVGLRCPHLQFYLCCELGLAPPFEGNCPLTNLLALAEASKHTIYNLDQSKATVRKLSGLLGKPSLAHRDIEVDSQLNDFAVPTLLKLEPEALKEPGFVELLFTGGLSQQATAALFPVLQKLTGEQIKQQTIQAIAALAIVDNNVPLLIQKHFMVEPKSRAGVTRLLEVGWGKHCLTDPAYLNKKNGPACMLLLYKMLLKQETLATLILQNFNRIEGINCCEVINIMSHIARLKLSYYPKLNQAGVMMFVKHKLQSEDQSLAEKALNLLGNLCKHSTFFYTQIEPLMGKVLASLTSPTKRRRQAIFVLGNLFFYNDKFSDHLLPKYGQIVAGLQSADDTIIENTIGLLINLYKYDRWTALVSKQAPKIVSLFGEKIERNRIIFSFLLKASGDKSLGGLLSAASFNKIVEGAKTLNLADESQIKRLQRLQLK